ncbi:phospholipase effector Tle1 domain-containing protein [Azonexus sp. IMCC34839]|uniref:phospholipase effector Tle1 domain-containing protein n=1 Tax=Azonexus sp. IMCC34839 TaxID=3133695 RepID=UPI00399AF362
MLFGRFNAYLLALLLIPLLSACALSPKKLVQHNGGPHKIAVFFDGTANDEESDTNIKRLHSLVSLQKRTDVSISTIYIEGVGADGKVLGMAMGWGIGARVRDAYAFLLENYSPGDQIYIFGFSRGAYSGRILASMLNSAGLPERRSHSAEYVADVVYAAFKGKAGLTQRREQIDNALQQLGLRIAPPVGVEVMGLWDTVEALGVPDYAPNIEVPNSRYGDQLCNVKQAYHAMSIDDDRERIFTPILLTRDHLLEECGVAKKDYAAFLDSHVDEVWFSGAHADVGGGYQDSLLGGVSLNWMLGKLRPTGLLPPGAGVPEDRFCTSHDPEKGLPWAILYHRQSRNLERYTASSNYNKRGGTPYLKIHRSVIERLAKIPPRSTEYPWQESNKFWSCFKEGRLDYVGGPACRLMVVD